MSTTITLDALVHPCEQPALRHAAQQLSARLGPAQWPVTLRFATALTPGSGANLVVASLLGELAGPAQTLVEVGQAWRARLAPVQNHAGLFLCTAFRAGGPNPAHTAARARRINRLAAELSRETGAQVIDVDRVFALLGARAIAASGAADALAGQVIAHCLLAGGLDGIVPPAVLDPARAASVPIRLSSAGAA